MKENVEKSMFYLTKERRESKYKILLFALIIMLFNILNSSRVYAIGAFDINNTLQGKEVTTFENSLYETKRDENGYIQGILERFTIIDEYTDYDELHSHLSGGGEGPGDWDCICDNSIDYKGKYFMLETNEYVGRNIEIENLGNFEYVDRVQNGIYIYLLEITNNNFKKDNGEHRYFEIISTEVDTNKKYLNKLEIAFYGQRLEQPEPEQPQPEQPQPEQPQPEQPQPEQPQPEQPEPEQPQPEQPEPEQQKHDETKLEETTSSDNKVQNQHKLDDEPKTGIINIVAIVGAIICISSICFVICKKKMYK